MAGLSALWKYEKSLLYLSVWISCPVFRHMPTLQITKETKHLPFLPTNPN